MGAQRASGRRGHARARARRARLSRARVPPRRVGGALREYLERYHSQVQRFFGVQRGAPLSEFEAIADRHPVFELIAR